MKKFILYLVVCLMLAMSATAYSTIVSIGVISMNCAACAGGALTGMTGTDGIAAVSTSAVNCNSGSYVAGTSNAIGTSISNGNTYSTGAGGLTSGTTYYACLRLTENPYGNLASVGLLSTCTSGGTISNRFALAGATCNSQATAYIGAAAAPADTIAFPFVFIA